MPNIAIFIDKSLMDDEKRLFLAWGGGGCSEGLFSGDGDCLGVCGDKVVCQIIFLILFISI